MFDQTPEEEAFHRWHNGEFHEVERLAAAAWRKALGELDLVAVRKGNAVAGIHPEGMQDAADAKAIANALVNGPDKPYTRLALAIQFFHIPQELHLPIAQAWQSAGKRTLPEFAPYAAYALAVEIFFQSRARGWIDRRRTTFEPDGHRVFVLPAVLDGLRIFG